MNRVVHAHVFHAEPIKGSRFRASVNPVATEAQALGVLAELRAADPDATHHCWAFRLANGGVRCSDDGEPSGTAGRPILARLEGRDLVDVLVVVSRWYGGTKLGAGGLVRAYGRTAGDALDQVAVEPWQELVELVLTYDYADAGAVDRLVPGGEVEYGERVRRVLTLPVGTRDAVVRQVIEATASRVEVA